LEVTVNAAIPLHDLTDIYHRNAYADVLSFDDFEAVAGYATGTREDAIGQLFRWLRPIGSRPLSESAIENALRSRDGLSDYVPGSRVLSGFAMGANATATVGGRYERHVGDVAIPEDNSDVPCWWSHRGDIVLGRLVHYERDAQGPGSLRVWLELAGGREADRVLREADYGRVGLSVGVWHNPKQDDGGGSVAIDGQSLREVSLVPLHRAAFEGTKVSRVAMPARAAAAIAERSAHGRSAVQHRVVVGAHWTKIDGVPVSR
jgi:hypothetical protein